MFSLKTFTKKYFSKSRPIEVVIISGKRTPVGSFLGSLSEVKATSLGAIAIKGVISESGALVDDIDEVIMGNVISAGLGQAPARQAALMGGLKEKTVCTTINKVCSSGLKAVTLGASSILTGHSNNVIAGGFECMSLVPHYAQMRKQTQFGNSALICGIQLDGLTDAYDFIPMGLCAESTNKDFNITRTEQDDYCELSYERALKAIKDEIFAREIIPVEIADKKGELITISKDEEPTKFRKDKFRSLRPAFDKQGSITAANSSKINDGGCAFYLSSSEYAKARSLKPIARIIDYVDAETTPKKFSIAPSLAIQALLERTGKRVEDISCFEINEAFASVVLANMKLLKIPISKMNLHGGAVALGHPIGMSGARILLSLLSCLKEINGQYGIASVCNGGGGSTAILIERLN